MHNKTLWTADDLVKATGGQWLVAPGDDFLVTDVAYYKNHITPGCLAIATDPSDWDSHYKNTQADIDDMFTRGAVAVVTSHKPTTLAPNQPVLLVKNTWDALYALAHYARARFQGKVICVTGSVGKSSTKHALSVVLSQQAPTGSSRKNFNHAPGVPLSITQTPQEYAYGVYEFCIDLPRRTLPKAMVAKPDVAIITDIQPDHMHLYPSIEKIIEQKCLLFKGLTENGVAVLNRDNPHFYRLEKAAIDNKASRLVTFGAHRFADIRLLDVACDANHSHVKVAIFGQTLEYDIPIVGMHNVRNSLAVLAGVAAVGGDCRQAAEDFRLLENLPHHNESHLIPYEEGMVHLIDDTFSANPASIRAAYETLELFKPAKNGRRLIVLADVKELGEHSARLHRELAKPVIHSSIDKVFTIGQDMQHLSDALPRTKVGVHTEKVNVLLAALKREIHAGDVVMVKGSRRGAEIMVDIVNFIKNIAQEVAPEETYDQKNQTHPAYPYKIIKLNSQRQAIDITLVGDTSFGENYQNVVKQNGGVNILEEKGYDYSLEKMRARLVESDYTITNLETPITDIENSPFAEVKSYVHWTHVTKAPAALLKHNMHTVSLANNHTFDYGQDGFLQTLKTLDENKMDYFGAGSSEREASIPFLAEINNAHTQFRFAVVGAYEESKSYRDNYACYAGEGKGGINPLHIDKIAATIESIRRHDPSTFIILFPHWGSNYKWKSKTQTQMAHQLIDLGADLIIGHGAHMLQEVEYYKNNWIVYSLGNFMFNSPGRYARLNAPPYSLLSTLVVNGSDQAQRIELRLYPIITDNKVTNYQPCFVDDQQFNEIVDVVCTQSEIRVDQAQGLATNKDQYGHYFTLPIKGHKG